ncbi:cytochrome b5-like [Zerene cesonia]|uniref:cytochrome b5-like n=1 Tax=Zerene cesonia TaxID=33412 RepID=UPI0018E531DE|nr:cytochrome b5-like [Zerene cesonia]
MDKIISLQELKKHNSQSSVWMVIHNDVYDVTAFLQEHPGGEDTLLDFAGKDGTQGFEDVGHSDDARELLKKYKIGTLAPGERTAHIESCSKLKWAVLALAGAIVIGFALKKYLNK